MRVKLMAEYCCDFPVWIDFEEMPSSSVDDATLRSRIERWNSVFLTSFDAEKGWSEEAIRQNYAEEGERIFAALTRHFGESSEVTYDAWPVT
ncbi:hypothetical protein [Nocardioides panaciterrulae]|uniref:Uncharacterized protein n=1 Tax=Nocardioides panaciterrulae TaxID=661492 RepID=A0A7Y9E5J7_9ACTN|nr:hypothetical protein [Nocardioides panaciterrulae]NYD41535.1 hypothetical protein [Nocardioides panaciterrulae]